MDKRIISKVNMFTQVNEVLQDNPAILESSPAFNTMATHLQTQLTLIEQQMQILLLDRTGFTEGKTESRETLAQLLMVVCDGLKAYAATTGNYGLLGQVSYSYSKFMSMRGTQLQETAATLYALAMMNAAALLPYNVDATTLADLNAAFQAFKNFNPMPRTLMLDAKATRQYLFQLVKDLNNYLHRRIDPVAGTYQISHPQFYERYFLARRNYSEGIRHEQPIVEALDTPAPEAAAFDQAVQEMQQEISSNGVPVE